jgi:hypothetical protein
MRRKGHTCLTSMLKDRQKKNWYEEKINVKYHKYNIILEPNVILAGQIEVMNYLRHNI